MISEFHPPILTFGVVCGAGFYVRSLVHDLGLSKFYWIITFEEILIAYLFSLNMKIYFVELSSCAHVVSLERTRQGPFSLQHCVYEEQCTKSFLRDKIEQLTPLVDVYMDEKMAELRKKSSQWEYRT